MKPKTLKDLYVDGLKDPYSAESQILKALPKLTKAAGDPDLKRSFQQHEKQTREHVRRLERICESMDVSAKGKKCVGMEGLLKEGAELIKEKPTQEVLDAGLISAAQHVEHYEIAGYGTARTWAELLEHQDHAKLLQQTLDEERETDKHLTRPGGSLDQPGRADRRSRNQDCKEQFTTTRVGGISAQSRLSEFCKLISGAPGGRYAPVQGRSARE